MTSARLEGEDGFEDPRHLLRRTADRRVEEALMQTKYEHSALLALVTGLRDDIKDMQEGFRNDIKDMQAGFKDEFSKVRGDLSALEKAHVSRDDLAKLERQVVDASKEREKLTVQIARLQVYQHLVAGLSGATAVAVISRIVSAITVR